MYVQKSKLQHAADAAVLAGGYTYVADWDDPDKRTQVLNSMKKYLNSDIDNGQIEKVVYRFKDNDEAQGVMISLYAPHGEVWLTGNKPVVGGGECHLRDSERGIHYLEGLGTCRWRRWWYRKSVLRPPYRRCG